LKRPSRKPFSDNSVKIQQPDKRKLLEQIEISNVVVEESLSNQNSTWFESGLKKDES